jgi:GRF zinc finger
VYNITVTAAQAKARSKNARYGGYEDSILQDTAPLCPGHQQPSKLVKVNKSGPNKGRKFYSCCMDQDQQCKFFLWAEDNPALIALTLADNAATAERDRLLGPEEAKRAAAVRSFCQKVSLLTRPELQREIQKFKKRREQCAYLDINSGSIKETKKEQDKGKRRNKNKSGQLFPLTVGGSRQELLDLLEQEATRLIHHSDSLSEGVTGGGTVTLKRRVTPCADSDEDVVGGRDERRVLKRDVKGDERRGERRDVRKRGAQAVVAKKREGRKGNDSHTDSGKSNDDDSESDDNSDNDDNSEGDSDNDNSEGDDDNDSSSSMEVESREVGDDDEEDESDIDIVEEELNGGEKLSESEQMIMLSSDEEDSVSSSAASSSSPSCSGTCKKKRKLSASRQQVVKGKGKEGLKEEERVRGAERKEGVKGVEGVDGKSSRSSSSSTALRPIDVALRSCFGYSSFRPGQR